jgi:hypothetical protein
VDALRDDGAATRIGVEAQTVPALGGSPERVVAQLREASVTGVLTYSDDECRLHAVALPDLEPAPAPSFQMCRPATSSGGLGAVGGEVVWAGLGYGFVQVVLSRAELSRAIRPRLGIPADAEVGFRAVQAVALDEDRYLVLADSTYEPTERVLAAFEGERALFVQPRWLIEDARALRPSPRGGYYALLGGDLTVYTRDGGELTLPEGVQEPRAVAWSPDERWTALATEVSVYLFPSERPEGPVLRIPLAVGDLDWTAEPQLASAP